jgi:hypothetical protein
MKLQAIGVLSGEGDDCGCPSFCGCGDSFCCAPLVTVDVFFCCLPFFSRVGVGFLFLTSRTDCGCCGCFLFEAAANELLEDLVFLAGDVDGAAVLEDLVFLAGDVDGSVALLEDLVFLLDVAFFSGDVAGISTDQVALLEALSEALSDVIVGLADEVASNPQ